MLTVLNRISYEGCQSPPPSGIGDCSKKHEYINLKPNILKKNWIAIFFFSPLVLKKWTFQKLVGESKLINMIFSSIRMRLACTIWVLYLQNQASYSNFWLVNVMQNLNFTKFLNPEIWNFSLNFCMLVPLNIPRKDHYCSFFTSRDIKARRMLYFGK